MSEPQSTVVKITQRDDQVLVMALEGDIDMRVSPGLLGETQPLIEDAPPRVVVDLTGVGFMDSSGVGTLVHLFRLIKARDGSFVLAGPNERVRSIFQITRLDKLFTICQTVDEAIGS